MKQNTTHRTFPIEFKQQAVELALASGDILQTARDLGVDQSNLLKWIARYQHDAEHAFHGSGNPRDFSPAAANRVWAGDITYLRRGGGFVYLAVVMDLYSRKIIGWSVSRRMQTSLVSDALKMALAMRGCPIGFIFHSDRGSQYANKKYRRLLADHQLIASMSRKGDCWDNSPVESFFATLKKESDLTAQMNFTQIRSEVFEYIAVFYNRQRPHSFLNGSSPENFEINHQPLNKSA